MNYAMPQVNATYCQTPVLGLGLGVDFTVANNKKNNNPHLIFHNKVK